MSPTVIITACILTAVSLMAGISLVYSDKNVIIGTLIALGGTCVMIITATTISEHDIVVATGSHTIEPLLTAIVFTLTVVMIMITIGLICSTIIYFISQANKSQHMLYE